MAIRPLDDKIVLEAVKREEKTASGIMLPDTAEKERPEQGKVIAVGQGKLLDNGQRAAMSVKVGDTVIFSKYGPSEIKIDGKEYLVVKEEDVLAIIE